MPDEFPYDVFLSHSAKDQAVVRPLAERLRADGVKVWFDEWVLKPGDSIPAKIEEGLERSRVLVLCMSAHAFGSDWAQLESGTFRFRDPLNKERRFLPLRLDNAPIPGSLSQFLYINWLSVGGEKEYAKLLEGCHPSGIRSASTSANDTTNEADFRHVSGLVRARLSEWKRVQTDFEAQAKLYHDLKMSIYFVTSDGATIKGKFPQPNHSINLWQYFGSTQDSAMMDRLRAAKLTKFGITDAEVTALGLVSGEQTNLFCKIASRAGSLLPDEISRIVIENLPEKFPEDFGKEKPVFVTNGNPLAKWLNMMLVVTTNSHPERFRNGVLSVDPFAASLSIFDYFAPELS